MNSYNRQELVDLLKEGQMKVKFTKANGEVREMNCTLASHLVPVNDPENGSNADLNEAVKLKRTRAQSPDCINVWDLDKYGWRSFRVDSIIEVTV